MRAREFITELRDRMYQYIRSIVPTWPEYVVQDWLYKGRGKNKNYNVKQHYSGMEASQAIRNEIIEMITDAGLSPNTNPWQLVPNMKFTMDMFEPKSKRKLIGRAGGTSDMGMGIPKDAERHATQAALIQQGGVSKEPAILIKFGNGYELLEGWHRTIQHFAKYPDGYVGPAYVAVAQGKPGVTEGFSNDMSTEDMIAYLRQHHDTNLHQDYLDHINTFSKFVLQNIPVNSIKTDLPALDRAKVEQYKQMDFSKAPPIVIGGGYILDGYHRANVAKALGIPTIKAYVGVQGQPGVAENMDHSQDGRAVEELKSALLAKRDQLQSATDDQVYDIIDKIMTRIARSHSISGQKLHDMWVDRYKQIPDTWIMNENFADGKGPGRPGDSQRHGIPKKATMAELEKAAHAKGRKGQLARWQLNMRRGKKK